MLHIYNLNFIKPEMYIVQMLDIIQINYWNMFVSIIRELFLFQLFLLNVDAFNNKIYFLKYKIRFCILTIRIPCITCPRSCKFPAVLQYVDVSTYGIL